MPRGTDAEETHALLHLVPHLRTPNRALSLSLSLSLACSHARSLSHTLARARARSLSRARCLSLQPITTAAEKAEAGGLNAPAPQHRSVSVLDTGVLGGDPQLQTPNPKP